MKTSRIIVILIVLLFGIVIYVNKCNNKTSVQNAGKGSQGSGLSVNGIIVRSQDVSDVIHVTGTLLSNKEVLIRNEVAGKLVRINFREGSRVQKGELLAKIYDDDLQAQLKKLQLDAKLLANNEKRLKDLLLIQGVSQQEYDQAQTDLLRAEADIDLVKVQIEKTEIRAPFNGQVGLEKVSEGSILGLNTEIVSIQDLGTIKLEFSIPEKYKSDILIGQTVFFTVEPGLSRHEAKIYAFEPKIDPSSRSLLVRAHCDNSDGILSPGSFARLEVPLREMKDALMIPTQAIIPELKGYKLFIRKEGKAFPVKVSLGVRNDSSIQILSGIQAGDTVLTDGIMQLRPEMPVNVNLQNQD